MTFLIRFPSLLSVVGPEALMEWLQERGEPCDVTEEGQISLQALPLSFTLRVSQWEAAKDRSTSLGYGQLWNGRGSAIRACLPIPLSM